MKNIETTQNIVKSCLGADTLLAQMNMRTNKTFCDATIRLDDGSEFHVHRIVMSSSCHFFRFVARILLGQLSKCLLVFRRLFAATANDGDRTVVQMNGIETSIMQNIIDFAYSRMLNVNETNVFAILTSAHYIGIKALETLCSDFIVQWLNPGNCISCMLMARSVDN